MTSDLRARLTLAAVLALATWAALDALWIVTRPGAGDVPVPITVAWPALLALLLLAARRAPLATAAAVVALELAWDAFGHRLPGGANSIILIATFFVAEAFGGRGAWPKVGAALGAVLIGGLAAMDATDRGYWADAQLQTYTQLLTVVIAGTAAGFALRDRRALAADLEQRLAALRAGAGDRIGARVASERARIAAEVEDAVALLLHRVRPLAERAAEAAAPARLAEDMRVAGRAAREAMTELRRVLHLLRAPDAPDAHVEIDAARRRAQRRRQLTWVIPVALLAALGIVDQVGVPELPQVVRINRPEPTTVPAPALGPVSPFVTAVLSMLPLLAARRAPVAAALSVFALVIARFLVDDLTFFNFSHYYVVAITTFLVTATAPRLAQAAVVGAAGVATTFLLLWLEEVPYEAISYGFTIALPTAAAIGGLLVREPASVAARARRAQAELDRAHEELARERIAAERLETARELHDVVGHAVTIIELQSAVAVRFAELDQARARAAARTVLEVATEAERDLARLSRLLDAGAEHAPPEPLTELVARVRAAGLPVTLDDRVPDDGVPLALGLTAFRLVQEALTNVRRHAGAVPTTVTVGLERGALVVDVVNERGAAADGGGSGRGVAGMRERAELYGGTFAAGPTATGGWRVHAALPVTAP
jgi:signal transduction histidine kinase